MVTVISCDSHGGRRARGEREADALSLQYNGIGSEDQLQRQKICCINLIPIITEHIGNLGYKVGRPLKADSTVGHVVDALFCSCYWLLSLFSVRLGLGLHLRAVVCIGGLAVGHNMHLRRWFV